MSINDNKEAHSNETKPLVIPSGAATPVEPPATLDEPTTDSVTTSPMGPSASPIDPESPFAPFNDLRAEMVSKGVDFAKLDEKVASGIALGKEEIDLIAQHSGRAAKDVEAYMSLVNRLGQVQQKATAHDTQRIEAYEQELNAIAGGSWKELIDYVAANETPEQIKIFNVLLNAKNADGTPDTDLQKTTLKQMNALRTAKGAPRKGANLNLLAQANSTTPTVPNTDQQKVADDATVVNPLEGNPLADAPLGMLCNLKINPKHPGHANAVKVLKARYPELA